MISDYFRTISIIQIGVGGTGSWLVKPITKFLNNLARRFGERLNLQYKIIDSDIVEDRNIYRQNFESWHIGQLKSKVLALTNAEIFPIFNYSINIKTKTNLAKVVFDNLTSRENRKLCILLGCVDNNKCRKIIYSFMKNTLVPVIYLDSGNNLHNGQIVSWVNIPFITKKNPEHILDCPDTFKNHKNISFNKIFPKDSEEENTGSCAFFGDQSQSINMIASTQLFSAIQKIIIESEMPPSLITFNSSGMSLAQI